jgi:hypothetical protein
MSKLRTDLQHLAEEFSLRLVRAISHAPVSEIFARRPVDAVVHALGGAPEGMRSDQLREALHLRRKEVHRALREAVKQDLVRKRGQRRGTTYFVN